MRSPRHRHFRIARIDQNLFILQGVIEVERVAEVFEAGKAQRYIRLIFTINAQRDISHFRGYIDTGGLRTGDRVKRRCFRIRYIQQRNSIFIIDKPDTCLLAFHQGNGTLLSVPMGSDKQGRFA